MSQKNFGSKTVRGFSWHKKTQLASLWVLTVVSTLNLPKQFHKQLDHLQAQFKVLFKPKKELLVSSQGGYVSQHRVQENASGPSCEGWELSRLRVPKECPRHRDPQAVGTMNCVEHELCGEDNSLAFFSTGNEGNDGV